MFSHTHYLVNNIVLWFIVFTIGKVIQLFIIRKIIVYYIFTSFDMTSGAISLQTDGSLELFITVVRR